ncbi:pyridoxamine 5'-phosphate oxidase family protein [Candidatus Saccharibacteria bacterium]|nr:pyridoxamine 5'-phosphate oxidase family protein [Candidatus Saccharibacteria bacterium]MCL1963005.1 pyridoxamine 5'-phosphate oxidase family protein [Candidatus Saccharibacteria bacterium]
MKDVLKKVENLVAKSKTVFVASIDENGFPNMKAMLVPRKNDFTQGPKIFWFSTNTSSMRVGQYQKNPRASIYFYEKGRFNYQGVMLIGKMEVLTDAASKEMLWQFGDTLYYKKGVTDPDYCVLKFTAERGRYYSNFKSESFKIEEENA